MTALAALRADAPQPAALGSIKANIGHTRAAAGVAGLLKAVLAMSAGTLPPTTGCKQPHPLLRAAGSTIRVLAAAQPWPDGQRLAGVSSMGFGGTNAHVVLCRSDGRGQRDRQTSEGGQTGWRPRRSAAAARTLVSASTAKAVSTVAMNPKATKNPKATNTGAWVPAESRRWRAFRSGPRTAADAASGPQQPPRTEVYAFSGDDPAELAAELSRIAGIAEWYSDSERCDLACQEAGVRGRKGAGRVRGGECGRARGPRRVRGQARDHPRPGCARPPKRRLRW